MSVAEKVIFPKPNKIAFNDNNFCKPEELESISYYILIFM